MRLNQKYNQVLRVLGALLLPAFIAGQGMAAEGPSLSGFVDFGYNYNFNKMPTNTLRSFDAKANSFSLEGSISLKKGTRFSI